MENKNPVVDFSYIIELGGGRKDFVYQVLSIFMENTAPGLKELEQLVRNTDDWDAISKQAHFLKSSVGIVKVRGMQEHLHQIELLGKEKKDKAAIVKLLDEIIETFAQAEGVILEQMEAAS
ncbi:MAG TPA: Hpt domain-containing protein [Flavipsychrobacter sp.]|nr:Hpt domain-containing protein [Flavipsychrobacter sp.]